MTRNLLAFVLDDISAGLLLLLVVELLEHPPALLHRHLGALFALNSLGNLPTLLPGHIVANLLDLHPLNLSGNGTASLPCDLLALLIRHLAALLTGDLAASLLCIFLASRGPGRAGASWGSGLARASRGSGLARATGGPGYTGAARGAGQTQRGNSYLDRGCKRGTV